MPQYPGQIAIVSPASDAHAAAVRDRLRARGVPVHVIDTTTFPRVTLGEALDDLEIDGVRMHPSSAYIRARGPQLLTMIASRWEAAEVPLYNAPSAVLRTTPPYQLGLLAAARVPVPRTQWTNDPETLGARADGFRAVGTGTELRPLECVQEPLTGDPRQVYVVDGEVVACEPLPVSDATRRVCARAAHVLGLRFACVELRSDGHGLHHVVSVDAFPSFLDVDAHAGTDILGALCDALVRPLVTAALSVDEPATIRGRKRPGM